ncbi:hypothetical protein, variant [Verruconis gallopava]|uniref:Nucleoporin Nup54 alpha-helical domain-containing protein n=1 Tax=Verruconis gallopava TaxID=253628 RepID=A0A0D1XE93_9PEZI|nr:hypothetical protein, variant [Verruconis gallopava]KIW00486.1 hypothetical protein, variant [Verruconis gallopava]
MTGFGRSLSLNTGSNLFGNTGTNQQQSSATTGGLFGGAATTQSAQSGGLFGTSNATSQPPTSGGLFGNNASNTQTSKPGGLFSLGTSTTSQPTSTTGGLFGAAPAASTAQTSTGGLFGSTTSTASKPTGLFGTSTTSSAQSTGGLFGATTTSSAAPSGGLFGSTTTTSQPASGGLFGSSTATSKPAGLFGSSTATTAPAAGGLFGSSTATSQPASGGLFGAKPASGGLFGQSTATSQPSQAAPSSSLFGALNNANTASQPTQQTVAAVKIDWTNVKPTTRFNELHQEVQDAIVFIDEVIQGAIRASIQCSEAMPAVGQAVNNIPNDVEYLERRLETVEGALSRDAVAVGNNKEIIEKDSEDAVRLFRAIENLKLPNQFHYPTISGGPTPDANTTTDLLSYFSARAAELEHQTKVFERHQREVDAHLRTVEHTAVEEMQKLSRRSGAKEAEVGEGLREIAMVMRTFEEAILRVAERVGEAREKVVDLELGGVGS